MPRQPTALTRNCRHTVGPRTFALCCGALVAIASSTGRAQEPAASTENAGVPAVAPAPDSSPLKLTPLGYVEAHYSYNFNRPSNGITNYRGFDNRHNTFTLSNVALGANWQVADVVEGRLVLQVGHTPSAYYGAEPSRPGAGGANGTDAALWKYIQEAWVSYRAPIGRGLRLQAGLFLSPIGPETIPIKESWNWSRSNLFFGLPFYHSGLRATYDLTSRLSATAAVYNGWNSVTDNNEAKSLSGSVTYKIPDTLLAQVLYFGGVERSPGSAEGPYWRHLFDAYVQWDVTKRLSFLGHANAGWEPNRFGTSRWFAGAIYGRVGATSWLYVAVRGDRFWEGVPSNTIGSAAPIFWPTKWVSSGTVTLDFRPTPDNLSVRLEYRHDQADGAMYFRGTTMGDGSAASPFVPNARSQDTLTLGATSWF
jgi:hypothetical protein